MASSMNLLWLAGLVAAVIFTFAQAGFTVAGKELSKIKVEIIPALFIRALITTAIGTGIIIFFNIPIPDNTGMWVAIIAGGVITLNDSKTFKAATDEDIGPEVVARLKSLGIVNLIVAWVLVAEFTDLPQLSSKQRPLSAFMEAPFPSFIILGGVLLAAYAVWQQRQDKISWRALRKVWPLTLFSTAQAVLLGIYVMRYDGGLTGAVVSYIAITSAIIAVGTFALHMTSTKSPGLKGLVGKNLFKASLALAVLFTMLNVSKYAATGLLGTPIITDLFGRLNPLVIRSYHHIMGQVQKTITPRAAYWQWWFVAATFAAVIGNIFVV